MQKGRYNTKQRDELLDYLKSKVGEHITAADICKSFSTNGLKIGTTTVYRQLEKMVEEGIIKKYIIDSSTAACFEYIDVHSECKENGCTHLKCTKCGRLIHLHCDDLKATEAHILKEHGFKIDMTRTVLYGLCENCC